MQKPDLSNESEWRLSVAGMEHGPAFIHAVMEHYNIPNDDLDQLERRFHELGRQDSVEALQFFRSFARENPKKSTMQAGLAYAAKIGTVPRLEADLADVMLDKMAPEQILEQITEGL